MKITILLCGVICIFGILTSACRDIHLDEDLYEEHYDFLRYSLGDFEFLGETSWSDSFLGEHVSGRGWNLQFTRYDGTVERFSFRNSETMGHAVELWVARYGARHLEALVEDYFSDAIIHVFMYYQWDTSQGAPAIIPRDFARIVDPEAGLQLQTITVPELVDWDFTFRILVISTNQANYSDDIEELKAATRTLATYFGQEQVDVLFSVRPSVESVESLRFGWRYNKQADVFEVVGV